MTGQKSGLVQTIAEPTITAIMPAHNCRALLGRSLAPLLQMQREGEICEVIVVDDGSSDGTAKAAISLGARVISSEERRGPAHARNHAAQESLGEILWFIDSDVVARKNAPHEIRQTLNDQHTAAVIGSYDDSPAGHNFFSQYKNLVHHYYHQKIRGDVSTFWAGCGAVWKQTFLDIGGFDAARYPRPSIEDIELGYRLQAAGGRIRHAPELQATHLKVWTFWKLIVTDLRDRAVPWAFLVLTRATISDELNISVTERIRAAIAWTLVFSILTSLVGVTSWWLPAMILLIAFASNLELFALFQRRNGLLFAFSATLFHQFYYLYSTTAYCLCWVVVRARKTLSRTPSSDAGLSQLNESKISSSIEQV
jgi:glycosyltransferase involved in cell wall biosynthesis